MNLIFSIADYDYFADELMGAGEFERGVVERSVFPDGEHYLRVATDVFERDVIAVGGTISDTAMLELYDLACAIVENGASTLTLIVPRYGYATRDRAAHAGDAVTAKHRGATVTSLPDGT